MRPRRRGAGPSGAAPKGREGSDETQAVLARFESADREKIGPAPRPPFRADQASDAFGRGEKAATSDAVADAPRRDAVIPLQDLGPMVADAEHDVGRHHGRLCLASTRSSATDRDDARCARSRGLAPPWSDPPGHCRRSHHGREDIEAAVPWNAETSPILADPLLHHVGRGAAFDAAAGTAIVPQRASL